MDFCGTTLLNLTVGASSGKAADVDSVDFGCTLFNLTVGVSSGAVEDLVPSVFCPCGLTVDFARHGDNFLVGSALSCKLMGSTVLSRGGLLLRLIVVWGERFSSCLIFSGEIALCL